MIDRAQWLLDVESTAEKILDGSMDPLAGCRKMSSLGGDEPSDSELGLEFFAEMESLTDHFPFGPMRDLCSERMLARSDAEEREFLKVHLVHIREACRLILEEKVVDPVDGH